MCVGVAGESWQEEEYGAEAQAEGSQLSEAKLRYGKEKKKKNMGYREGTDASAGKRERGRKLLVDSHGKKECLGEATLGAFEGR